MARTGSSSTPSAVSQIGTPWTVWATGGAINTLNASSGTSTAPVNGTIFWAQVPILANSLITGITYSIGTVGGTNSVIAALYSGSGVLLGNTALAGVTVGTSNTKQSINLVTPVTVLGPRSYFIALQFNGNTARFLTFSNAEKFVTGSTTGTFGTLPSITPGTSFSAGTGPFASTY